MSLLSVLPDIVSEASRNLANIGSTLHDTVTSAMQQTTAIAPPAADEVSAVITALFAANARDFQLANGQATSFHDQFVNLLNGGAAQYFNAEIANAENAAINAINTPAQALLGHPLIRTGTGHGSTGAAATALPANSGSPDYTTTTQQYGPLAITTTSSPTSSSFDAYFGTPFGPFSLLSASYFVSPENIGTLDSPLMSFGLNLDFFNHGFGWTASGLPSGSSSFDYSLYAKNFWDTHQGFYLSVPTSGSGPVIASVLEDFWLLGPTGVSFVSQSGGQFVPWIVFNGSPILSLGVGFSPE